MKISNMAFKLINALVINTQNSPLRIPKALSTSLQELSCQPENLFLCLNQVWPYLEQTLITMSIYH